MRPTSTVPTSRWGIPDAIGGFVAAFMLSVLVGAAVLVAGGWDSSDDAPMWAVAVAQVPLWAGLAGAAVFATYARGARSLRVDFGLDARGADIPLGLVLGVAAQYIVNFAISWPIVKLSGTSFDEYEKPARELADKAEASSSWGIVLFVVVVAVGAPLVEELFWRGLVQRSLAKRLAIPGAIAATAVLFGLAHGQLLQFPALAVFGAFVGWLAHRTGRLGLSIFTHVGFNATTVVVLLLS